MRDEIRAEERKRKCLQEIAIQTDCEVSLLPFEVALVPTYFHRAWVGVQGNRDRLLAIILEPHLCLYLLSYSRGIITQANHFNEDFWPLRRRRNDNTIGYASSASIPHRCVGSMRVWNLR